MRAGTPGDRKSTRLNSSHQSTRRLTLFPYTTLFRSNCSGATVGNDAPAIFPKGVTTVTWTVTDASGNTGRSEEHTSELQSPIDTSIDTLSLHDALPI